jgi:hypothetical protein
MKGRNLTSRHRWPIVWFGSEENLLRQRKESESLRQKEAVVFPDKYSDKIIAETMDLPSEKPCDIYLTYMKDECIQVQYSTATLSIKPLLSISLS